ncbi:WD40 repeat-like protein [Aulographum hederae CBS 113979]|uniref:WD40 repeat-like protein n=1 Tax=Aulographum hederae CBS 113979 TaxID=1176131 RepID=A0A6G1GK15_9PEZI|nr:WD40 repeat-like protein [Aulographum hederae CBS 113979]
MAWQSPVAMNNGGGAGGEHQGPAGTEYTLQGVMRFLQMQWHDHERARNAWDIERAEAKAKISKQEGELRKTKAMNNTLEKHVRLLEQALKSERANLKALQAGKEAPADESKENDKGKAGLKEGPDKVRRELGTDTARRQASSKPHNSFLDLAPERASDFEKEDLRDKSKTFLTRCVEEITYLLTPAIHPPSQGLQSLGNSEYMPQEQMSLEQAFSNREKNHANRMAPAPMPNHQPPPVPSISDYTNMGNSGLPQPQPMVRESSLHSQPQPQTPISFPPDSTQQSYRQSDFPPSLDEPAEKITHSYDEHGQEIAPRGEDPTSGVPREIGANDQGQWDFSEEQTFTGEQSNSGRPGDAFPSVKSPPRAVGSHGRRGSAGSTKMTRKRSQDQERAEGHGSASGKPDSTFKVRFALRGHLDVVRSVIFTGGGSPSEPEICTAGDDGVIKRWIIPASWPSFGGSMNAGSDLDIQSYFTHRGHDGVVTSLTACPASASFSTGGRTSGDGWIFSGGQDATVRVWERGRVDPKATLDGHTDAVWAVCVLPTTSAAVFGTDCNNFGGPDRVLLASGSADGTIKIWAVSAPPQLSSPQTGSRRGVGGSRRHSVTSGSNFPSSPQPSIATTTPFHYTLVHSISRHGLPSPTCITPLSRTGETFVVSYTDSSILIFDTRSGEEIIGMASTETYDGTPATGVNAVVATTLGAEGGIIDPARGEEDSVVTGATGNSGGGGVEGIVISGHEDRFIRFFDANSGKLTSTRNSGSTISITPVISFFLRGKLINLPLGQCTYTMLAHPSAISSLSLAPTPSTPALQNPNSSSPSQSDIVNVAGLVSAGHDASVRFWDMEKRSCIQDISSHRIMRGEGVCAVAWSGDGRLCVSAGGDGVVKVFAR